MAKRALKKTNACRALDALGLGYELRSYAVDESDLSAESVASKVALSAERVFKTLCLRADDNELLFALVSAGRELDLKALARAAQKKTVAPVAMKELMALTGYIRGGVTALACKKPGGAVYLDERARGHASIAVSAGLRGLQIVLAPEDYATATRAVWAPLSREPAGSP